MSLFKNDSKEERNLQLDDYNKATKSQKFAAFLIAVGTMLVTIVICFGIFFATRWVYRKITGNEQKAGTSINQVTVEDEEETSEQKSTTQVMPVTNSAQKPQPQTQTQTGSTPNTGPETIPNTGPESMEE